jgi:hypothetical protein
MKIVILGTSNSVMGQKGYVRALRQNHDVVNLSTGRVGVAFHMNRLLEHHAMIEAADLLIVDHYINDINGFGGHLGDGYAADLTVFFDTLRCLNTHVINLMFPFLPKDNMDVRFYDIAKTGMRDRNLCLVDLNEIDFKRVHHLDEIHLTAGSSYLMGMILAREIARLETMAKPSGGEILATPFRRYSAADLMPGRPRRTHSNRLMSFDYLPLDEDIHLPFHVEESLYGVGYFTPKDHVGHSGIVIGSDRIGLASLPANYFHENVETTARGPQWLGPMLGDRLAVESAMGRGRLEGTFAPPLLVDVTTRRHDIAFAGTPSQGPRLEVDMSGLLDALEFGVPTFLTPSIADILRDRALAEEGRDVVKAHALMEVAATFRPDGPLIRRKIKEYAAKISRKGEGATDRPAGSDGASKGPRSLRFKLR